MYLLLSLICLVRYMILLICIRYFDKYAGLSNSEELDYLIKHVFITHTYELDLMIVCS